MDNLVKAKFELLQILPQNGLVVINSQAKDIVKLANGEDIFTVGIKKKLDIAPNSITGILFRRLRDEAHRFAVTYHRLLRSKEEFMPLLVKIPGIGEKKLLYLLEKYNSINELKNASITELANIEGIDRKTATYIYQFFRT